MKTIAVTGADVSTAWLAACQAMSGTAPVAYHTVVRIEHPAAENRAIRSAVDELLAAEDLQPAETVANTIFPAAIAATSPDHLELTRRYLAMLPTLRRLSPGERTRHLLRPACRLPRPGGSGEPARRGHHPAAQGNRQEGIRHGPSHRLLTRPGSRRPAPTLLLQCRGAVSPLAAMPVRAPGRDNGLLGFPCLSHCSFQLDRSGTLHAMAHYRSHLMVERAYGNYLGLGRLLGYIAGQAGLDTGELTVTAGYARLDCRGRLSALLRPILRQPPPRDAVPSLRAMERGASNSDR